MGVIFDPRSLIQALADVVGSHMSTNVLGWLCKWNSGARAIGSDVNTGAFACGSIDPEVQIKETQSSSHGIFY